MSRESATRLRRGFVLVAALVVLVIVALLVTGAFFAAGQEIAVGRAEVRDQQTFAFAEYSLAHAIGDWNPAGRGQMAVGETVSYAVSAGQPLESTVFVTRLDSALYVVVAEARAGFMDSYGLRRRAGILVTSTRNGAKISPPVRVPEQAWSELY